MKTTIKDLNLKGKKVFLRTDFNVPLDENKNITSDKRITETLPTIRYILEQGGAVVACSHLGRPKKIDASLSLKPVAQRLSELLGQEVVFASDVAGSDSVKKAKALKMGQVMLIENVRFDKGEEINDEAFAAKLASLADVYVNDAFGTAHRAHASTVGVAKLLPNAVGFLMQKELEIIGKILENPDRPFISVLGGAKIADKIKVIDALLDKVDVLLLGGGMAYNFIKALGGNIGASMCDDSKLDYCISVLEKAKTKGVQIVLPVDFGCATAFAPDAKRKNFDSFNIPQEYMGMDIGKKTAKLFSKVIKTGKTVIWNGTLGVAEFKNFEFGSKKVGKALTKVKGTTIIGGGDSAAAMIKFGFAPKITHISTGGGATLELLEGSKLPGVEIIKEKKTAKK